MKKIDFIAQYIINRSYLHNTEGAEELNKWMEQTKISTISNAQIDNYLSNIEIEISNAEYIADKLEEKGYFE